MGSHGDKALIVSCALMGLAAATIFLACCCGICSIKCRCLILWFGVSAFLGAVVLLDLGVATIKIIEASDNFDFGEMVKDAIDGALDGSAEGTVKEILEEICEYTVGFLGVSC